MTYDAQETILKNAAEDAVLMLRDRAEQFKEKARRNMDDGNPNTAQAYLDIAKHDIDTAMYYESALKMKYPAKS